MMKIFRQYSRVFRDPQYESLEKIVGGRHGQLTLVTQFRGSRKSFLARMLCVRHPEYILVSDQWEFQRLIGLGQLRVSSVLLHELRRFFWDYVLLMCLVTVVQLLWWLTTADKTVLRNALREWITGRDKDMSKLRDAVGEWKKDLKLGEALQEELSWYALLVTCITIFIALRASGPRTVILDDVLEFAPSRDEVQAMLSTAASLATRHRVVLLSSNEGIVNCFRDRCSTVYDKQVLPAPTAAALANILKEVIPGAAPTADAVTQLTCRVPPHLALSMRFHVGAVRRSTTLLSALTADAPLTLADTIALFETVMEIDLESDQNFRSLALLHSPPYEPVLGGIQTPDISVPRRLAVTCAVVDLCQRLEQRCILSDLCKVLKVAISAAEARLIEGRAAYVPAVAEERRHAAQMELRRELHREQLQLQLQLHRETLELSPVYWLVKAIRFVGSGATTAPTPTPVIPAAPVAPTSTYAPKPTPPLLPRDEALLRLHSVFPQGTPVLDALHDAARHVLSNEAAAAQTVDEAFAVVFGALPKRLPTLAVQVAARCQHRGGRMSSEQERKLEWYIEQWKQHSSEDVDALVGEPTFRWDLLADLSTDCKKEQDWGMSVLMRVHQRVTQEPGAEAACGALEWLRRAATPLWGDLRHEYRMSV